jgi:hypothetical protein
MWVVRRRRAMVRRVRRRRVQEIDILFVIRHIEPDEM